MGNPPDDALCSPADKDHTGASDQRSTQESNRAPDREVRAEGSEATMGEDQAGSAGSDSGETSDSAVEPQSTDTREGSKPSLERTALWTDRPNPQSGTSKVDLPSDTVLVQYVMDKGFASEEDMRRCFVALADIRKQGQSKSLAEVLVDLGVLSEGQLRAVKAAIEPRAPAPEHAEMPTASVPESLGSYEILEELGAGAMGAVFKARHTTLDRIVALKVLPEHVAASPEFVGRFVREARVVAKLDHPNVVRAFDAGEADGRYFFAMEIVDGQSLGKILDERGKLPEEEALGIALQSAHGLDAAWRAGLVHRDIKPDNILISTDGVAKIADLGLARESDGEDQTRLTQEGYLMGSPHYIAPEQARGGEVDIRADIYSLGATFYRMLTGDTPFHGKDAVTIIMARYQETPKPVNEVSREVSDEMAQIIATMMARDSKDRYPDPAVLLHDLELVAGGGRPAFASGKVSHRRRAVEAAKTRHVRKADTGAIIVRRRRRKEVLLILAGVAAVAIVAVTALLIKGRQQQMSQAPTVTQASAAELARRREVEAARKKLEGDAAALYAAVSADFEAKRYDKVVKSADEAGDSFVGTEHGPKLDRLRTQAHAKIEEARLRAEEKAKAAAEKERQYREFIRLAREELNVDNYARAMDLLVQAKAIEDSKEVSQLLGDAKCIQHTIRAKEAEKNGALKKAAELYKLALEIRSEDSTRERLEEVRRLLALADSRAAGDRLAREGKWPEAKEAYAKALELAVGGERAEIEKKTRAADKEISYAEALGQARAAVEKKAWEKATSHARSALAVKPGDRAALVIIELAKDAMGPEPEITNSIGMQFILVPASQFSMGSEREDDEGPVHKVSLDAYYIGKYEVTNAQFEQFSPAHRQKWKEYSADDEMPVIAVSWDEATAFCKWLSRKEGIEYRLPTEAEWERAARGTDGRIYPWGNDAPDAGRKYRCNYAPEKARETWKLDGFELISPVGALPAGVSPVGCHDMAGNVWEWCLDWYSKTWYSQTGTSNPTGPDGGAKRVLRGGSITSSAKALRCANRLAKPSAFYEANIGFRCVRALKKGRLVAPLLEE